MRHVPLSIEETLVCKNHVERRNVKQTNNVIAIVVNQNVLSELELVNF